MTIFLFLSSLFAVIQNIYINVDIESYFLTPMWFVGNGAACTSVIPSNNPLKSRTVHAQMKISHFLLICVYTCVDIFCKYLFSSEENFLNLCL